VLWALATPYLETLLEKSLRPIIVLLGNE